MLLPEVKRFYDHLDLCWRCRASSLDMCDIGEQLLKEASDAVARMWAPPEPDGGAKA